jgi:4-hydroxy-tetrahydrodipicolinate synthase
MFDLTGTGVALITPFTSDLSVDVVALRKIVNHVIEGGVEYLVVLGTTAETATLSSAEKKIVIETVVDENRGRLPLVLGLGGNNTNALIEKLKKNDFSAFQVILSVTPYYNKPNQEGLYQHYAALAKASPLPIILYNVPGRTGINLLPSTVFRLANDFKNIVAIKEATGDLNQISKLLKDKPTEFAVISGDDGLALPVVLAGGAGVISVIAGAVPSKFSEMVRLGLKGENKKAYEIHFKHTELIDLIFEQGNPAGIKNVNKHLNLSEEFLRLPLVSVSSDLSERIKKSLAGI